jgi:hypothetical protein
VRFPIKMKPQNNHKITHLWVRETTLEYAVRVLFHNLCCDQFNHSMGVNDRKNSETQTEESLMYENVSTVYCNII